MIFEGVVYSIERFCRVFHFDMFCRVFDGFSLVDLGFSYCLIVPLERLCLSLFSRGVWIASKYRGAVYRLL